MSNEQYLTYSYLLMGALSLLAGLGVYAWLRRPFGELAEQLRVHELGRSLRRIFPLGTTLAALAGFVSVSYTLKGCEVLKYEQVVADRAHLVAKNQEQGAAILSYLLVALLAWGLLTAIVLAVMRRRSGGAERLRRLVNSP